MPKRLLTPCDVHIDVMHYAKLPADAERVVSAVKRTVDDHLPPLAAWILGSLRVAETLAQISADHFEIESQRANCPG